MDLAPGSVVFGTVLFDFPLALAADFDARAVDQQVERTGLATTGNLDRQRGLPAAQRAETWNRPVQLQKLQQTAGQPSGLPQCEPEQDFQRQAAPALQAAVVLGPVGCAVAGLVRVHPGSLPTATRRRWEGAGQRVMQQGHAERRYSRKIVSSWQVL